MNIFRQVIYLVMRIYSELDEIVASKWWSDIYQEHLYSQIEKLSQKAFLDWVELEIERMVLLRNDITRTDDEFRAILYNRIVFSFYIGADFMSTPESEWVKEKLLKMYNDIIKVYWENDPFFFPTLYKNKHLL